MRQTRPPGDPPVLEPSTTTSAADLLTRVDMLRLDAARKQRQDRKAQLGQYFTPAPVALLMASMLAGVGQEISILDAGAGVGSLFAAAVAELCARPDPPRAIQVTAFEVDAWLAGYVGDTFRMCREACERRGVAFAGVLHQCDFIMAAVDTLRGSLFGALALPPFTCAILNPPYHKIHSQSPDRQLLRRLGIETSNIYTGFLAAAIQLLDSGGELVAITPRSFCNGPYFRPFRKDLLRAMAPDRFHVFESRQEAFSDDQVLQETVIFHAVKGGPRTAESRVQITSSAGPHDEMFTTRTVPFAEVVRPADPQAFIRLAPDEEGRRVAGRMAQLHTSLAQLGLTVSTGRVVDFRAAAYLRPRPGPDTIPLIYPTHFSDHYVAWPRLEGRKPNALHVDVPANQLVPNEHYVLTRRFSAKEEKRRVVAAVYDAGRVAATQVGFENHLNYYHRTGRGIDLQFARGLAAFLNSSLVDAYFRQFNGHTQVNATDLRSLTYPTHAQLEAIGARIGDAFPEPEGLDALIEEEVFGVSEGRDDQPMPARQRLDEALAVLRDLGLPGAQQNDRSALTLLALLDLRPETPWAEAGAPLRGITPMMEFFAQHYGRTYAPNTRETVRRQSVHQFLDAGLIAANPDDPARPINSGKTVYQVTRDVLELVRTYGTPVWEPSLRTWLASAETLRERYAREREMARIPVRIAPGTTITLSPGGQNVLIEQILGEFAPRFTPGATVLYVGDTDDKSAYFDRDALAALGVAMDMHGKMPDAILHDGKRNWLVLVEAVTSHGPIDPKRRGELTQLFGGATAGLVFVTAFLSRRAMVDYLSQISWETEVWVAESPSHLIHFDGERFLGPHDGGQS